MDEISVKSNPNLYVGDQMTYRGVYVQFMYDPVGDQNVAMLNGNLVQFGTDNTQYRDDAKLLIDDYLDTISRFEEYPNFSGFKLEWFQNGKFRDIRLKHQNRILKVYTNVGNLDVVQADAVETIRTYVCQPL